MTQDLYYVESGYLTPDSGYYVYTADAESAVSSQATMTVAVGVIREAVAAIDCVASVAAVVSHIHGADLVAFSNAAIATEINVIRATNVALTSVFSAAIDAVRGIYVSAQADSIASVEISNTRVRYTEAAVDAAFSLACDATKILGGTVLEAEATLFNTVSISVSADRFAGTSVTANSEFNQTTQADRFANANASLESICLLSIDVIKTAEAIVDATALVTVTADSNRTRNVESFEFSEFTPTLLVDVFKNSFAVLDSLATVTADISVERNANILAVSQSTVSVDVTKIQTANVAISSQTELSVTAITLSSASISATSNFSLDLTAKRTRNFLVTANTAFYPTLLVAVFKNSFAVLDSIATLNVDAIADKSASATLSTSVSMTTLGGNIILADASLVSTATLYTKRYFGNGRPHNLVNGTPVYNTSIKKFGSASLASINNTISTKDLFIKSSSTSSEDFYMEGWVYVDLANLAQTSVFGIYEGPQIHLVSGAIAFRGYVSYNDPLNSAKAFYTYNHTPDLTLNTWHHVAVVKSGGVYGRLSVYLNGTRIVTWGTDGTSPIPFYPWGYYQMDSTFFRISGTSRIRVDEVFYVRQSSYGLDANSTSIAVPTAPRDNGDYVQGLWHLDSSIIDDTTLKQNAVAALATPVTVTATLTGPQNGSADLSTISTLSVVGANTKEINLVAFTNASLTAYNQRTRNTESNQDLVTSVSANLTVNKSASSSLTITADLTSNVLRFRDASASWQAFASELIVGDRFAPTTAALSSEFTTSTTAVKTVRVDVSLDSQSSLAATTANSKIGSLSSAQASEFTQTSTNSRTRTLASTQTAFASELVAIGKVGQGLIGLDVTATLTVTADVTSGSVANLYSQSQLTANNLILRLAESALVVTASLTAVAVSPKTFSASLTAVSTVSCTVSKTTGIIALEAGSATLTAGASATRGIEAHLDVLAFELAVGSRTQTIQANLSSQSSLVARIGGTFAAQSTMQGFASELVVADIIHIDAKLTWMIFADDRDYSIEVENRTYSIVEEDRDYSIVNEDREYAVTRELLTTELQGV